MEAVLRTAITRSMALGILLAIGAFGACEAAGRIPYGTRTGMDVTVREMDGIDTDRAVIRIEHTRDNAREYCTDYAQDRSEACIDKALRDVKLGDTLKGNCRTGRFTTLNGQAIVFAGPNLDHDAVPNSPEYLLFGQDSRLPLSMTTGSGYFVDLEQFKALCPARFAQTMLAMDNRPRYIGRWHLDGNQKVCRSEDVAEGLLVYKSKEFAAIETVCKFTSVRAAGRRYDVTMRCASEGQDSTGREILEVKQGKLERTVMDGRKPVTFTYDRCPN